MSKWVGERPELLKGASVQEALEFTKDPTKQGRRYERELVAYRARRFAHAMWSWTAFFTFVIGTLTIFSWFR